MLFFAVSQFRAQLRRQGDGAQINHPTPGSAQIKLKQFNPATGKRQLNPNSQRDQIDTARNIQYPSAMPHTLLKKTLAVLIALACSGSLPAWSFTKPQFIIAPGGLRNFYAADAYCKSLQARLPTAQEANIIYQLSLDPVELRTRIANYDGSQSTGSFWTSNRQVVSRLFQLQINCPVLFSVVPGNETKTEYTETLPVCGRQLHSTQTETVCVTH